MIFRPAYIFLLSFLLAACAGEFRPDPVDPRLPVYSEENYEAGGALINGIPWRYVRNNIFLELEQAFFNADMQELFINMNGEYTEENSFNKTSEWVGIHLSLDADMLTLADLQGKVFVLDGEQSYGSVDNCEKGKGQLYIRKVEAISGGSNISGTFSFTIETPDCEPYQVSHGRFDLFSRGR